MARREENMVEVNMDIRKADMVAVMAVMGIIKPLLKS